MNIVSTSLLTGGNEEQITKALYVTLLLVGDVKAINVRSL